MSTPVPSPCPICDSADRHWHSAQAAHAAKANGNIKFGDSLRRFPDAFHILPHMDAVAFDPYWQETKKTVVLLSEALAEIQRTPSRTSRPLLEWIPKHTNAAGKYVPIPIRRKRPESDTSLASSLDAPSFLVPYAQTYSSLRIQHDGYGRLSRDDTKATLGHGTSFASALVAHTGTARSGSVADHLFDALESVRDDICQQMFGSTSDGITGLAAWMPWTLSNIHDNFFTIDRIAIPKEQRWHLVDGYAESSIEHPIRKACFLSGARDVFVSEESMLAICEEGGSQPSHTLTLPIPNEDIPITVRADAACLAKTAFALSANDIALWSFGDVPSVLRDHANDAAILVSFLDGEDGPPTFEIRFGAYAMLALSHLKKHAHIRLSK